MYTENIPLQPYQQSYEMTPSADEQPQNASPHDGTTSIGPGPLQQLESPTELPVSTPDPDPESTSMSDPPSPWSAARARWARTSAVPAWLRRLWRGPDSPCDYPPARFSSWLAPLDALPDKMPFGTTTLAVYCALWLAVFLAILWPYLAVPALLTAPNGPTTIVNLACTDQLWAGKNGACGLNGEKCITTGDVVIRCPALCDRSWTYTFMPVGDQLVKYRGYFVGGGAVNGGSDGGVAVPEEYTAPYRADSFVCGSAVHAGLVSPFTGGCARLSYRGGQTSFALAAGRYGTDDSIEFNSYFPASYVFTAVRQAGDIVVGCRDPRMVVLVMNIVLALPVVYFGLAAAVWWTTAVVGFWTIALATDPPLVVDATDPGSLPELVSLGLERFLPSCFILYVLWQCSARHTFGRALPKDSHYVAVESGGYRDSDDDADYRDSPSDTYRDTRPIPTAYLKRLLLYHPPFWLGVLNNITFDRLPVDRLTVADLKAQAGSIFAVAGIILLVVSGAIVQAVAVWRAGQFRRYIKIYAALAVGLAVLALLPGLTLRVHHYILAMLLIPGCFTKGSTAIAFQGILLGIFLLGAARWGLASIAESEGHLRRGDPGGGMVPPLITSYHDGILSWDNSPTDDSSEGQSSSVSVLINDLERYVGGSTSVNLTSLVLQDAGLVEAIATANVPLYVRLGRVQDGHYGDFTAAAVIYWHNQTITMPKEGLT